MRIHMAKDADRPWASRAPDAQRRDVALRKNE